jgi:hypothetical protein
LDIDKHIKESCDTCHTCASLKRIPKHINEFTTSDPCDHIGQRFSVDVLKRASQSILVARETVSSYTSATFIKSEKATDLLEGVSTLILPLHPIDGPPTTLRSDPAPGFQTLHNSQPLRDKGITFEIGRRKNPNKNPIADKAIQELEDEILRIQPTESKLSSSQLSHALSRLNSRIRFHGLSSYELMFRRNQFSADQLDNNEEAIIASQHQARTNNHPASWKSQQPKSAKPGGHISTPAPGSIVYLKNDKTKHKAREQYLVVSNDGPWLRVSKLAGNNLRSLQYDVHASECFTLDPISHTPKPRPLSSSEDEASYDYDTLSPANESVINKPECRARPEMAAEPPGNIITDVTTDTTPMSREPSSSPTQPAPMASHSSADDITDPPPASTDANQEPASPDVFIPRRGTRIRKPPNRYGDFVTHFGEEWEEEEAATPGS